MLPSLKRQMKAFTEMKVSASAVEEVKSSLENALERLAELVVEPECTKITEEMIEKHLMKTLPGEDNHMTAKAVGSVFDGFTSLPSTKKAKELVAQFANAYVAGLVDGAIAFSKKKTLSQVDIIVADRNLNRSYRFVY